MIYLGRLLVNRLYKTYEFNALKMRGPIFYTGLAWSLIFVIYAFNMTTRSEPMQMAFVDLDPDILDMEVTNKRTAPPPKKKLAKVIPNRIDSIVFIENDPIDTIVQKIDTEIDEDAEIVDTLLMTTPITTISKNPAPPAPLPPPKKEEDLPLIFVEEMPRFPGCEEQTLSTKEKENCANKELLKYVMSQIKYPTIARENGITGPVVVRFVVDRQGQIADSKIMRDIGGGCGAEVIRVLKEMNSDVGAWTPGRQQGRKVKVLFTLPVRFTLDD